MDAFSRALLKWSQHYGRHDLPWQRAPDPYRVWVSEIMLQQTQVATVIAYFERFVAALPTLTELAAAPEDRVLALWAGLGYYSRARNLHRAAKICVERHGGDLPDDYDSLVALPGIGRSTAGAILALSRDLRYPILDGNVKRVLARYHAIDGWPGKSAVQRRLWELADEHTPRRNVAAYTQAIMDLGATLCTPRAPACERCPLAGDCQAYRRGGPESYPGRRPPRVRPLRHSYLLVYERGPRELLLQRRPPAGIWGGLWSLPLSEAEPDAAAALGPEIHHGFTHFKLNLTPLLIPAADAPPSIMESAQSRWCGPEQAAELGLPRPIRRFVDDYFSGNIQWQEPFTASN